MNRSSSPIPIPCLGKPDKFFRFVPLSESQCEISTRNYYKNIQKSHKVSMDQNMNWSNEEEEKFQALLKNFVDRNPESGQEPIEIKQHMIMDARKKINHMDEIIDGKEFLKEKAMELFEHAVVPEIFEKTKKELLDIIDEIVEIRMERYRTIKLVEWIKQIPVNFLENY